MDAKTIKSIAKKYGLTVKQVEAFDWMWAYEFSPGTGTSFPFTPGINHRFLIDNSSETKNLDFRVLRALELKGFIRETGSGRIYYFLPNHTGNALRLADDLGIL